MVAIGARAFFLALIACRDEVKFLKFNGASMRPHIPASGDAHAFGGAIPFSFRNAPDRMITGAVLAGLTAGSSESPAIASRAITAANPIRRKEDVLDRRSAGL
jgi:hypothetical protein